MRISARFVPFIAVGLLAATPLLAQDASAPAERVADGVQKSPSDESPVRQPTVATDINGKSIPPVPEKLVLADPATKLYMPCRDANESSETEDSTPGRVKLNPKAAVLTEEAAKQHGYKPSPHKVECPKK